MTVKVFTSLNQTASVWQKLEENGAESIFQTFDWCQSWQNIFGQQVTPFIITANNQNELTALAPLYISKNLAGLPLIRVSFLGTGPADYGGFVFHQLKLPQDFNWLFQGLEQSKWHCLDLHQLNKNAAEKLIACLPPGLKYLKLEQEPCLVLPLAPTYEQFLSSLSKKFKTNLLYAQRRLHREQQVFVKYVQTQAELSASLNNFFNLHQKRWRKRKLPGIFFSQKNRRLHLLLAEKLLQQNRLILAELLVDSLPIASFYGFKFQQTVYYYLGGFDPEWSKHSPLSVLILDVIAKSIKEGYQTFDFLRGIEPYKKKWGAKINPQYRLVLYKPTLAGRLAAKLAKTENGIIQSFRKRLHS